MTKAGRKDDSDKLRWDLLPWKAMEEVVSVLTFGARKYSDNGWKKVPHLRKRYRAAALRHLASAFGWREMVDSESGKSHLAHAICCLLFIAETELTHAKRKQKRPNVDVQHATGRKRKNKPA